MQHARPRREKHRVQQQRTYRPRLLPAVGSLQLPRVLPPRVHPACLARRVLRPLPGRARDASREETGTSSAALTPGLVALSAGAVQAPHCGPTTAAAPGSGTISRRHRRQHNNTRDSSVSQPCSNCTPAPSSPSLLHSQLSSPAAPEAGAAKL
ncbi:hypothetical protein NDU88_006100 [Pleurodeles waltl]|uniref:Uncharacterized protein n=1 Tax=Pleurodeles waltl TaxID=8319 RepID=A0AAV7RM42_PLEWA|nr:hypothetical protein NDU88_006100 [Pleurodeles waltl]